jgi:2-oxoglutarate dehydrogenase E1 component
MKIAFRSAKGRSFAERKTTSAERGSRYNSGMSAPSFAGRHNLDAIEDAYRRWLADPTAVDDSWRLFFEGFELGLRQTPQPAGQASKQQIGVVRIIDAYRRIGHVLAQLDPLSDPPASHPLLELARYGLSENDLDQTFDTSRFTGLPRATLRALLGALRDTYCRTIGVEYMHIQDGPIRQWLQERMEPRRNRADFPRRLRLRALMLLHSAEIFEKFLHTRYLGQKRFSLEGAETLIPLLDHIVETAADGGVREIVFGMAHRGRLNVLANVLHKPYQEIFSEFEENFLPNSSAGDGDVKYHVGFSCDRTSGKGNPIHLSLTPNPSHLEAVDPVVEGRVRVKQHRAGDTDRNRGVALLIHGDAAFAGQGLVAETLNLSQLPGYRTGGTLHVVINNQIGFTTRPSDARSTRYCTDVAKMVDAPIFHVNSEDPEAVLYVVGLAFDFRQKFHKDVVIDVYCYRKHGHNEGDEPAYTNPVMTAKIAAKEPLSTIYSEYLVLHNVLSAEENQAITQDFQTKLNRAQAELKQTGHYVGGDKPYSGQWRSIRPDYSHEPVDTGVQAETLERIAKALSEVPPGFEPHEKIRPMLESRRRDVIERRPINWGLAELLAFGSLLLDGYPIRLSGQDTCRGTFSQRHAVIFDHRSEKPYVALQHLDAKQASFTAFDSMLSEAAVLGFEFGYALDSPDGMVLWEAQFGDFANGAQVIIDQFIVCSRSKWQRDSGLVMLLPHGYEGQGPEHSSARLERFLQLCAEDNIQVCNCTTPAQYFHLLRRQMHASYRRPLVIMTPKSLLRHKQAVSTVDELSRGAFAGVLDDTGAKPDRVRRVLLCSGKVYYDLLEQRALEQTAVAIVRIEQFYPWSGERLQRVLSRYPHAQDDVIWVQEESQNMGGWAFIEPRLRELGVSVRYVGRDASASPASGSRQIHLREQKELVRAAFQAKESHLVNSYNPRDFFTNLPKSEQAAAKS